MFPLKPAQRYPARLEGQAMAAHEHHGEQKYTLADGNEYPQHVEMYDDFLKIVKWTIISVVIVLAFLWIFIF
jgi:hypothetical protein